jgi:hypothetical protein
MSDIGAGEVSFYEAAVQVIPTLLVALAIEGRAFRPRSANNRIDKSEVAVLVVIFVAETLAFGTLAGNISPGAWIETILIFTIGAELALIISLAVRPGLDNSARD